MAAGAFFKATAMKLKFSRQHTYGNRVIKDGETVEMPNDEAVYFIRMGIAISVDVGEKVEMEHRLEKVEYTPVKEKRIVKVGRKSKK